MKDFTFVIIDRQDDFNNPNGSLYVNGAEKSELATVDFINKYHENIKDAVLTIDWHTVNHCSFKRNGGIWPDHCKQYSVGAGVSNLVMNALHDNNIPVKIFIKGNVDNEEEYGAFDVVGLTRIDSGPNDGFRIVVNNKARNCMVTFATRNIVVSGLAGDFCVKSSIENLLTVKDKYDLNIKVFKDGISSIDDGTVLDNFIKENNLEII
jgi:nicotinamidase/pyrazinamidase